VAPTEPKAMWYAAFRDLSPAPAGPSLCSPRETECNSSPVGRCAVGLFVLIVVAYTGIPYKGCPCRGNEKNTRLQGYKAMAPTEPKAPFKLPSYLCEFLFFVKLPSLIFL
jgi:hypothetical protein